jgi:DNA helicase HerA-like ATPase
MNDTTNPLPQTKEQFAIGTLDAVSGSRAVGRLDLTAVRALQNSKDTALAATGTVGCQVKVKVDERWLLADVRDVEVDDRNADHLTVNFDLLGEANEGPDGRLTNFQRGVTRYPRPGDKVHALSRDDLVQMFAAEERQHIEVGAVFPTSDVRAALFIDSMLGRHYAVVGSTGSGKSTLNALILHRILEKAPQAHVVIIDPHGEYGAAFASNGALFGVDNLNLPYWVMNLEEHCELFIKSEGAERELEKDILGRCLIRARSQHELAAGLEALSADTPIPYHISDLLGAIQAEVGRLEKEADAAHYIRLRLKIESLVKDPRYAFILSNSLWKDTIAAFLAAVLRLPGDGKPISIIDLSGVPSESTNVVVAVLSRLILDYAIWSYGEQRRPILLVCEEAQRYLPAERTRAGEAVRRSLEAIANEGRKYGVSLGLITQRPSDMAEGVLAQCGTTISMRLNNDRDTAIVRYAMPEGARGLADSIPALRNRECVICGEGVSIPVRVHIDDLASELCPASEDPVFSQLWNEVGGEAGVLERTVRRWRNQHS